MVRVLHVLGGLGLGGAESRIMDLYRNMDRSQVQFDFLVHMDPREYARAVSDGEDPASYRKPQFFDDEIRSLGGQIYAVPRFRAYNYFAYRQAMHAFFKEHHAFSVVQAHMTSTASIYLPIAVHYREASAKPELSMVTVAHTRNAGVDRGLKGVLVRVLRRSLPAKADFLFACSHLAGDKTFGGAPYTYIPNTIDTARFTFDPSAREIVRDRHNIAPDDIVIGNVARFSPQKNQSFLIRAFAGMRRKDRNIKLLLCGEGALRDECEHLAGELGVYDRVIFAGSQSEIEKYYSAMDIFAFPSIYEGLPGVVVEAQASGCKCLISDTITPDVMILDNAEMYPINEGPESWSRKLNKMVGELISADEERKDSAGQQADGGRSDADRMRYAREMEEAGFDVHEQAARVMAFYLDPCADTAPGASTGE